MTTDEKDPRDNPLFVRALEKGLDVLRSFSAQRKTMTLGEIANVTGLSRGSVQRLIYSLETMGYVSKHPKTRRFQLTPKAMAIGYNYLAADNLVDVANPFLAELSSNTGETTNLLEPTDLEMVYVARFASIRYIPIHMPIGSRVPMYCTSAGRAVLGALPEDQCKKMLNSMNLVKYTPKTIVILDQLMAEIRLGQERGFAINSEELFIGDLAIATPVIGSQGVLIGSVSIITPPIRWAIDSVIKEIAPQLIQCARSISNSMRAIS